jgi:hypothetical protein
MTETVARVEDMFQPLNKRIEELKKRLVIIEGELRSAKEDLRAPVILKPGM